MHIITTISFKERAFVIFDKNIFCLLINLRNVYDTFNMCCNIFEYNITNYNFQNKKNLIHYIIKLKIKKLNSIRIFQ